MAADVSSHDVALPPIDTLPPELIVSILSYLPTRDLLMVGALVCRRFYHCHNDINIWRDKCRKWYWIKTAQDWKAVYRTQTELERSWINGECEVSTLRGHANNITCLQFNHQVLVSGSTDCCARVWQMQSGQCRQVLEHTGEVLCVELVPPRVVTAAGDNSLRVFDLDSGACTATLHGPTDKITRMRVTGDTIYTYSWNGQTDKWSIPLGSLVPNAEVDPSEARKQNPVRASSVDVPLRKPPPAKPVQRTVGMEDRLELQIRDADSGALLLTLKGHTRPICCIQFDVERVVSGGQDTTVRVWDMMSGKELHCLQGHTGTVLSLKFDESKVVSGSRDNTIRIWDINTGVCYNVLRGHQAAVSIIRIDPQRIISGSEDHTLKVWSFSAARKVKGGIDREVAAAAPQIDNVAATK